MGLGHRYDTRRSHTFSTRRKIPTRTFASPSLTRCNTSLVTHSHPSLLML